MSTQTTVLNTDNSKRYQTSLTPYQMSIANIESLEKSCFYCLVFPYLTRLRNECFLTFVFPYSAQTLCGMIFYSLAPSVYRMDCLVGQLPSLLCSRHILSGWGHRGDELDSSSCSHTFLHWHFTRSVFLLCQVYL